MEIRSKRYIFFYASLKLRNQKNKILETNQVFAVKCPSYNIVFINCIHAKVAKFENTGFAKQPQVEFSV